jgi:hypothetical protein
MMEEAEREMGFKPSEEAGFFDMIDQFTSNVERIK